VETRPLGSSGEDLSVLGYGAWLTGADTSTAQLDPEAFRRAIDVALETGMTWIDTAELYAAGSSEELVGGATRGRRDRVFLSTKVAPAGAGSGTGMRPDEIRAAITGSLRRLQVEHVDLYLLHWYDPTIPLEESWGAMRGLVDEGLVRFVGVSNFGRELLQRCLDVGPVDAVQNQFSILHARDREGLLAWLTQRGIAYLGYGALAFGLLSGAVHAETQFGEWDWRSGRPAPFEQNYFEELFAAERIRSSLALARELSRIADELGMPTAVVALRWALEQSGVTSLVVGSLDPDHIRANARAGSCSMDAEALARIEGLVAAPEESRSRG
jgi:aryl-alcohol dehydrogenase-like predicted oxidoreductase